MRKTADRADDLAVRARRFRGHEDAEKLLEECAGLLHICAVRIRKQDAATQAFYDLKQRRREDEPAAPSQP